MKLKELRMSKNLKQIEIAKFLGITSQAYGNYESGRRQPDPETLIKLANYFNVTIDYLLEKEDKKMLNISPIMAKPFDEDTQKFLEMYLSLDDFGKMQAMKFMEGFTAQRKEKTVIKVEKINTKI